MSIDKQALREKFEAWAEEAGALPWGHLKKQRTASGNYSVQIYTYMWEAWSACHEAPLDELEPMALAHLSLNLLCEVYRSAYEEARHNGLVNWEAAASLAEENEDLKCKLEAAERRNAEQEDLLEAEVRLWTQRYDCANSRREAAEKRSAELSDSHSKLRETMAAIHNTIKQDGFSTPLAVIMQNAKRAHEESAAAAGISVKGE